MRYRSYIIIIIIIIGILLLFYSCKCNVFSCTIFGRNMLENKQGIEYYG